MCCESPLSSQRSSARSAGCQELCAHHQLNLPLSKGASLAGASVGPRSMGVCSAISLEGAGIFLGVSGVHLSHFSKRL